METVRRVIISTLTIGAFGGVGAVLWLLVAPNEQRRLEMRKHLTEQVAQYVYLGRPLQNTKTVKASAADNTEDCAEDLQEKGDLNLALKDQAQNPKNFPEANPAVMAEVRKRNELVLQAIKEAAETNENVSRKPPWGS